MRKKISEETIGSFNAESGILAFYEKVAAEMGLRVMEETFFDCRKILVASSIMKKWYTQFEQEYGRGSLQELTRHLLLAGPKEKKDLLEDEVEILDGFLATKGY